MLLFNKTIALLAICFCMTAFAQDCVPKKFEADSIVCVCNSTYCDSYPDPEPPEKGEFVWYVTSKAGKRLSRSDGKFSDKSNAEVVKVDPKKVYQRIEGFGGAFTDAAGLNIKSLSEAAQNNLINSYFSSNGSKYTLGRVPVAGTDFSTRAYTYDETEGDVALKNFKLAEEDLKYKIPLMKRARELSPNLRFVSASWTAPTWMKNKKVYGGFSYLLEKYYQVYADYLVKFLEVYKSNGLEIWAISTGNEPFTAINPLAHINAMFWSAKTTTKWVVENLGPSLQKSQSNETLLLMLDDQRLALPWYMVDVKNNYPELLKYVAGTALHWYTDFIVSAGVLDTTHDLLPDKFILMTESCIGDLPWQFPKVSLGSWSRANRLAEKLFENMNHWVVGWIDWNLALDMNGGPNWVSNFVDSPVIVEPLTDVFYKQPMYYILTHFSKFVPPSSVRIDTTSPNSKILSTAFKTKDDQIVVLLYNRSNKPRDISVVDSDQSGSINLNLEAYSLHTILYKNE